MDFTCWCHDVLLSAEVSSQVTALPQDASPPAPGGSGCGVGNQGHPRLGGIYVKEGWKVFVAYLNRVQSKDRLKALYAGQEEAWAETMYDSASCSSVYILRDMHGAEPGCVLTCSFTSSMYLAMRPLLLCPPPPSFLDPSGPSCCYQVAQ